MPFQHLDCVLLLLQCHNNCSLLIHSSIILCLFLKIAMLTAAEEKMHPPHPSNKRSWWNECFCVCVRKLVEKIVTYHHRIVVYCIVLFIVCRSIVRSTVRQFGTSGMRDLTQQLATRPCLKMCVPIISHRHHCL
ncbi:hypothetical protein Tsp_03516 [Trichinella spiralis]|uniref:hypothetical protein n=1 Tax=Trichinella spiralis TaxID=6334 RepID=UPI0001EFB420|nr:hypothetical protein Tsp_03516 [Trichinella spiralis]